MAQKTLNVTSVKLRGHCVAVASKWQVFRFRGQLKKISQVWLNFGRRNLKSVN